MRTYGRVTDSNGNRKWVVVETDANGNDDQVWITTLIQTLKLNLGESPFFANFGIPAKNSVVQQVAPDFYVAQTQQQFSSRFASLIVARQPGITPTYNVNITTKQGVKISATMAIPA